MEIDPNTISILGPLSIIVSFVSKVNFKSPFPKLTKSSPNPNQANSAFVFGQRPSPVLLDHLTSQGFLQVDF